MPRRKKLPEVPDYEGAGRAADKLLVQKSNPLQTLSQTDLTLPEFKILDAYLSRIDSRNYEKRTVRFEKGDLERLLGVTKISKDDLDKRLRNLFQVIEVKDETKVKGFKLVSLFEEADAEPDEDGLWQITLTCTPSAREYVFNIENIGYLSYRLKNVINLTSRYSYVLYLYLENNRYRKNWTINLDELKEILNCTADRYAEFKFFNSEILKKCKKEIENKTNLRFDYVPIRVGKKVKKIMFEVETQNGIDLDIDIDKNQLTLDDWLEKEQEEPWLSAIEKYNWSEKEIEEVRQNLYLVPEEELPPDISGAESIELRRHNLIAALMAEIERRNEHKTIKNKQAYLVAILKHGWKAKKNDSTSQKSINPFNDFDQRGYDWDELEIELFNLR